MSNAATARSAFHAFTSRDLAALKTFCAQDAVWYSSDGVQPGDEVHGRDAIIDTFTRLNDHSTTVSIEPSDYFDYGEFIVVPGTQHFANDNGSADSPFVSVLRFDRDGEIVHWEFHSNGANGKAAGPNGHRVAHSTLVGRQGKSNGAEFSRVRGGPGARLESSCSIRVYPSMADSLSRPDNER